MPPEEILIGGISWAIATPTNAQSTAGIVGVITRCRIDPGNWIRAFMGPEEILIGRTIPQLR
jgi:hypothetical protein